MNTPYRYINRIIINRFGNIIITINDYKITIKADEIHEMSKQLKEHKLNKMLTGHCVMKVLKDIGDN